MPAHLIPRRFTNNLDRSLCVAAALPRLVSDAHPRMITNSHPTRLSQPETIVRRNLSSGSMEPMLMFYRRCRPSIWTRFRSALVLTPTGTVQVEDFGKLQGVAPHEPLALPGWQPLQRTDHVRSSSLATWVYTEAVSILWTAVPWLETPARVTQGYRRVCAQNVTKWCRSIPLYAKIMANRETDSLVTP